jgi:hypothetical protein
MATIGEHVAATIDCFERSELDFAVLHACVAVDATARKISPGRGNNRRRFVDFVRDNYWIIEPTAMPGFDLEQSRFRNVPLRGNPAPDWAEIVYEVHRCAHAHGDQVDAGFQLVPGVGLSIKRGRIGAGVLEMPDNLPFGLLFSVVLSPANAGERVPDSYFLTLGHADHNNLIQLPINDWWGGADDFRPVARRYNKVRVNFQM